MKIKFDKKMCKYKQKIYLISSTLWLWNFYFSIIFVLRISELNKFLIQ